VREFKTEIVYSCVPEESIGSRRYDRKESGERKDEKRRSSWVTEDRLVIADEEDPTVRTRMSLA